MYALTRTEETQDLIYNLVAMVAYIIAVVFEVWYATGSWQENCNQGGRFTNYCSPIAAWIVAAVSYSFSPSKL